MQVENPSDQELWIRVGQGQTEAFSGLYRRFQQPLYSYAYRMLQSREEAKNVVHELFLDIWNKQNTLPQVQSPKAYLIVAVRRRALRSKHHNRLQLTDDIEQLVNLQPDGFLISPEDIQLADEAQEYCRQQVTAAINQLPQRQREVIYLRYYQELSIGEIAQVLSISYQTVSNHLQAAYRSLSKEKNLAALMLLSVLSLAFLSVI